MAFSFLRFSSISFFTRTSSVFRAKQKAGNPLTMYNLEYWYLSMLANYNIVCAPDNGQKRTNMVLQSEAAHYSVFAVDA